MTQRFVVASLAAAVISVANIQLEAQEPGQETHDFNTPFSEAMINPCNGESVVITGNLDTLLQLTNDTAGGIHIKSHVSSKGDGVGAFGTQYVYSEVTDFEDYLNADRGQVVSTLTLSHLLTSAGSLDDFYLIMNVHITVANGVPTAAVENLRTDCRG